MGDLMQLWTFFKQDQTQAPPWSSALMVLIVCVAASSVGCRSKLSVHAENGAKDKFGGVPKPDTVEIRGTKESFQSRDTVTIDINPVLLRGAPKFSVVNLSTEGASAANPKPIVQGAVPTLGLADDGSFGLSANPEDTRMTLSFYPADKSFKDKFNYGDNSLRILALDPGNPRYSTVNFTLYDFDIFDTVVTTFNDNTQIEVGTDEQDYQFQGAINTLNPPLAYVNDGSSLTTGYFNIINPQ